MKRLYTSIIIILTIITVSFFLNEAKYYSKSNNISLVPSTKNNSNLKKSKNNIIAITDTPTNKSTETKKHNTINESSTDHLDFDSTHNYPITPIPSDELKEKMANLYKNSDDLNILIIYVNGTNPSNLNNLKPEYIVKATLNENKKTMDVKAIPNELPSNFKNYIILNSSSLVDIFEIICPLQMDIDKSHINDLNKNIKILSDIKNITPNYITKGGLQEINALTTIAYLQLINSNNTDKLYLKKQAELSMKVQEHFKTLSTFKMLSIATKLPSSINTDISVSTLIKLTKELMSNQYTIK